MIAPGNAFRAALRPALYAVFAASALFVIFAWITTQWHWVRPASPWQDDPYDGAVSFTMQLVPIVAVLVFLRARLCKRREPLPLERIAGVTRGLEILLFAILFTVAVDWVAIVKHVEPAAPSAMTGVLIAALAVVTAAAIVAASAIVRARMAMRRAHLRFGAVDSQWPSDIVTSLPRLTPLRYLAVVFDRFPVTTVLGFAFLCGAVLTTAHTFGEGIYQAGFANAMIVSIVYGLLETIGVFTLGLAVLWYFRAVRPSKVLAGAGIIVILVAAFFISFGIMRGEETVALPVPSGSFAVGRQIVDWTDTTRRDPFDPKHGFRKLNIYVWYPAERTNAPHAQYQPGIGSFGPAVIETQFSRVVTNSVENAPVAKERKKFRALIMQPGLGGTAGNYTALAENLASHGYVVFGINPTYSTDVRFTDGSLVNSVDRARDNADFKQLGKIWIDDALFVAREIVDAPTLSPDLRHALEVRSIGFWGHSLGGSAALGACMRMVRCIAAADVDGSLDNASPVLPYRKPLLFLGHDRSLDELPADKQALGKIAAGDGQRMVVAASIRGTQHFNFSDRSIMYDPIAPLLHVMGPIDGRTGLVIARETLVRYFDAVMTLPRRPFALPSYPQLVRITI